MGWRPLLRWETWFQSANGILPAAFVTCWTLLCVVKGRSPSRALQPLMRRAGAACIASDHGWLYCPTRLNTANDPTPLRCSLVQLGAPFALLRLLNLCGLRCFAANWMRLVLLLSFRFRTNEASSWPPR